MHWIWYILSANFAIGTLTLLDVFNKAIFKDVPLKKKISAILSLYLLGVLILFLTLISLDWRNREK